MKSAFKIAATGLLAFGCFVGGLIAATVHFDDLLPDVSKCAAEGGCQWVSGKDLEDFAKALMKARQSHDSGTST